MRPTVTEDRTGIPADKISGTAILDHIEYSAAIAGF